MTARLVVLASGNGSNLQAIIDACADGRLDAEVVLVVTNIAEAAALARADHAGIPATVLARDGRSRDGYDVALADLVGAVSPDLVVLAGWMRLLTMSFLGRFPGRVINLHPALPGELPGLHAIERAYDEARTGLRTRSGVMVHLVPDEGVDDGPVLATAEVPIAAGESFESFAGRLHATEHALLVATIHRLISEEVPSA